jgi:hypothetical protein
LENQNLFFPFLYLDRSGAAELVVLIAAAAPHPQVLYSASEEQK